MAASSKFDMPSNSPERLIYTPRGSFTGTPLERSGSFRENIETPILYSLPSMSRSSASVTQGDVTNFLDCLHFDPKSIVADYKFSRKVGFKRLTSAALGLQVNDSTPSIPKGKPLPLPSPEDLKQLKSDLCESSGKARDRLKIFNEAMSVMNECFPGIPSRKRSRMDVLSSERANVPFSGERSVVGSSLGKAGTQTHPIVSGFEVEPHKSEEKVKIAIPNRRTRTSMVDLRQSDMRVGTPARSSGNTDREVLRLPSTSIVHGEERSLSVGVDSWEKSKKKRSGIKPDVSPSSVTTKPTDGLREANQGMQRKLPADGRPRLNDSHVFRPGVPSGTVGVGKADGILQPSGAGIRSSILKAEQDNSSHLHDRRDRPASVDKEKANLRAVNKTNSKEEFSSPSPTSSTKMNSAARAPRSGSNALHKLSPVVQRTTVANDWELPHSTSKNSAAVGANNRKRSPSMRPSSPPTQWASQRPQKISRTARRTNFVSIVSSNEESPALDATSNITGNETGSALAKRFSTNSPQQVKLKGDHFSSPALSESEESGATETKVGDKIKKTDEVDEKAVRNVLRVSTLPPRKNKLVNDDDHGDGVRRQGRTGRGSTSSRSLMPTTIEKLGNVGTAKQLRSGRLGFEKTESKVGRPPSRKPDRKPYTRQKHTTITAATDFRDDGHEELVAAAVAVTDPAFCFSSPFWRQMELYFSFISDPDLAYLKQQVNPVLNASTGLPILNTCSTIPNGLGFSETDRDSNHMRCPDDLSLDLVLTSCEVPLCQRLMAALISEEECEEFYSRNDGLEIDAHESGFELGKLESNPLNHQLSGNFQHAGFAGLNGYKAKENGRPVNDLDRFLLDTNMISEKGLKSDFGLLQNGILSDQTMEPDINISEFQYCKMSLDERILLELKSIGLSPEPVPDLSQIGDEEASEEIGRLKDRYLGQVATAKEALVSKLFRSASELRGIQEKEFERRALDKLTAMAYDKYMASWGSNPSGSKSTSSKMAKQAALAFVKRTLEHCKRFEDTGKSCFGEAAFRDILISNSDSKGESLLDSKSDSDSGKHCVGGSLGARVSAATVTQRSPSVNNHDIYSPSPLLSANHSSEQFICKEDSWSNRIKKRELLLDEVVGTIGTLSAPSGIGGSLSSSAKGKRSERDREGKGSREVASKNGTPKIGRTTSGNIKGDRKNKTKPKQKNTQVSPSVNGLVNKLPTQPKATMTLHPSSSGTVKSENFKQDDEFLEDPIDLSHLQLPGMDLFGGPEDLDGQGQDIGSWLNIDDELPDQEGFDGLDGLEIPMDDLSDLNMNY